MSIKKTPGGKDSEKGHGVKWIWTALSPCDRLVICAFIGDRTLDDCRLYFKKLLARINGKPLFVSDELVHYETVLKENFSTEKIPERKGTRGRIPTKAKRTVDSDLDYAAVHKTREKGKVVKVERKTVFGDEKRVRQKLLQSVGNDINTSYIERSNGILRQLNSCLRRKSLTFAKELEFLRARVALTVYFYNFIRPHGTLSKNPDKSTTPRTPAMVAGITDKIWTVKQAFSVPYIINGS